MNCDVNIFGLLFLSQAVKYISFFFFFSELKNATLTFWLVSVGATLKGMHFISWKPKNSNKLIADDDNQPTKNNLTLKLMKKVIH